VPSVTRRGVVSWKRVNWQACKRASRSASGNASAVATDLARLHCRSVVYGAANPSLMPSSWQLVRVVRELGQAYRCVEAALEPRCARFRGCGAHSCQRANWYVGMIVVISGRPVRLGLTVGPQRALRPADGRACPVSSALSGVGVSPPNGPPTVQRDASRWTVLEAQTERRACATQFPVVERLRLEPDMYKCWKLGWILRQLARWQACAPRRRPTRLRVKQGCRRLCQWASVPNRRGLDAVCELGQLAHWQA
jgi:hypothetical protein